MLKLFGYIETVASIWTVTFMPIRASTGKIMELYSHSGSFHWKDYKGLWDSYPTNAWNAYIHWYHAVLLRLCTTQMAIDELPKIGKLNRIIIVMSNVFVAKRTDDINIIVFGWQISKTFTMLYTR